MSLCSSCQSEITWVKSAISEKAMPLDAAPVPDGNVVIRNNRAYVLRDKSPVQPTEQRYVSHFVTCPYAAEHRRKK